MRDSDKTLLLGQMDQHNAFTKEVDSLRKKEMGTRYMRERISRYSPLLVALLLATMVCLAFAPTIAFVMGCLELAISGSLMIVVAVTDRYDKKIDRLTQRHTKYMESLIGEGNFLYLTKNPEENLYQVEIRQRETGEIVLNLGATSNLPIKDKLKG